MLFLQCLFCRKFENTFLNAIFIFDRAQMTIDYMSAVNSTLMQRYGFSSPTVIHAFEFNYNSPVCKFSGEIPFPLFELTWPSMHTTNSVESLGTYKLLGPCQDPPGFFPVSLQHSWPARRAVPQR